VLQTENESYAQRIEQLQQDVSSLKEDKEKYDNIIVTLTSVPKEQDQIQNLTQENQQHSATIKDLEQSKQQLIDKLNLIEAEHNTDIREHLLNLKKSIDEVNELKQQLNNLNQQVITYK
jgi:DNA repair exonuclease SbcCD ATPase subunit